jgi:8-oxo-dGTP diphosphatase
MATIEAKTKRACTLLSDKATLIVPAIALVDKDSRILLAQRPEGKEFAGYWEFPGGKIEQGETPEAALIREIREELGVETKDSCLAPISFASHAYENFHLILLLYICRRWQNAPEALEGGQLAWVRPQRLRNYEMPPANVEFIAILQDLLLP